MKNLKNQVWDLTINKGRDMMWKQVRYEATEQVHSGATPYRIVYDQLWDHVYRQVEDLVHGISAI